MLTVLHVNSSKCQWLEILTVQNANGQRGWLFQMSTVHNANGQNVDGLNCLILHLICPISPSCILLARCPPSVNMAPAVPLRLRLFFPLCLVCCSCCTPYDALVASRLLQRFRPLCLVCCTFAPVAFHQVQLLCSLVAPFASFLLQLCLVCCTYCSSCSSSGAAVVLSLLHLLLLDCCSCCTSFCI